LYGEEGLKGNIPNNSEFKGFKGFQRTDPNDLFKRMFGGVNNDFFKESFGNMFQQDLRKGEENLFEIPISLKELFMGKTKNIKIIRQRIRNGNLENEEKVFSFPLKSGFSTLSLNLFFRNSRWF
jgi:DnaJ-class molecular chaperone